MPSPSYPSSPASQSAAAGQSIATHAVAYASASARSGPTIVTLSSPVAGRPRTGSMMCAPRSATPDVATAISRPVTTAHSTPRRRGSAIPTRQGSAPSAVKRRGPTHRTSPPPLTQCDADPAAVSIAAARSIAQPFTYPDGSSAPAYQALKYPPLTARSLSHAASTSATSGGQSSTAISPRPSRLTQLSERYVENVSSAQCSQRTAPASASPANGAATSNDTTVPITCSACRTRSN